MIECSLTIIKRGGDGNGDGGLRRRGCRFCGGRRQGKLASRRGKISSLVRENFRVVGNLLLFTQPINFNCYTSNVTR